MNTGFFKRAEAFKPIFVRLLARHKNGPPMTDDEISSKSGLPLQSIYDISWADEWRTNLIHMQCFIQACEVNFESARQMNRVYYYLRNKPNFEYLRKHPEWKKKWLPMMMKWRNLYPLKLEEEPEWKPIRDLLTRLSVMHKHYKK
jgi:hypothetical protein